MESIVDTGTERERSDWRVALQKGMGCSGWQQCQYGSGASWGASNTSWSNEEILSCCIQCWCSLTLSTVCSSGPHNLRSMWRALKCVQRRAGELVKGLGALWGVAEDSGFVWFEEKGAERRPPCSPQLCEEGTWRERGTPFSSAPFHSNEVAALRGSLP